MNDAELDAKTTRFTINPPRCPACETKLDAATDVRGAAIPNAGDFSVCLKCGAILVFTEALDLRASTQADYEGADYESVALLHRARRLILERTVTPDHVPNYARDRPKGAAGD